MHSTGVVRSSTRSRSLATASGRLGPGNNRRGRAWPLGVLGLAALSVACDGDPPDGSGDAGATGTTSSMADTGPSPGDTSAATTNVIDGTETTASPGTTVDPDGTGSTGTSGDTDEPSTGGTGSTGSTEGTESTGSTGTEGSGTAGVICDLLLCDGMCCQAAEECINALCVAECATGIRCGMNDEICCGAAEICLDDTCVTPGGACTDSYDCAAGELCDPTLDLCIPLLEPVDCEVVPMFQDIDPVLEWSWETDEVASMPAVGDIDGDFMPEVIVNTVNATDPGGANAFFFGEIVVLDGIDGNEQLRITNDPGMGSYGSYARSTIGLGDVDGDSIPDIVYVGRPEVNIPPFANNSSIIHAVNGLGMNLWSSHAPDGTPYYVYVRQGAPTMVNLDADDASEIVYGTTVIDNDGTVVFDQNNEWSLGGGVFGSNGDFLGGISAAADLTGDGYPEIISGRQAWTVSWNQPMMGPPIVQLTLLWEYAGPDGYVAVADLDDNGTPEVILVGDPAPYDDPDGGGPAQRDGQLQVLDGLTGELWCGVDPTDAMCQANPALRTPPLALRGDGVNAGGGRGGPPVVADFDGDGRPEIGVAGATRYSVYDINRMGEVIVVPPGDPPPDPGALYVRWTSPIEDVSSNSTGSSAFDFNGDGICEVIQGDECYLRVYDGEDGDVLFEADNPSPTIHEYSVVADVDGDGSTEMVVVAGDVEAATSCLDPGYAPRRGVFAYRDVDDRWVRTRPVWNSHTYHVTNAESRGTVPPVEANNWEDPELNDYRRGPRVAGAFNAPNLEVDVSVELTGCMLGQFEVIVTIRNTGAITAPAGVEVTLYRGIDAAGIIVSTQATAVDLLPGAQTNMSWLEPSPGNASQDYYVVVDDGQLVVECVENDNDALVLSATCAM